MVVFTCNHCGDSLQKPKVAKHYQFQCRFRQSGISLTCVDCFKDFFGDQYEVHTKCITEAERYGGRDFQAKASMNKGERKQQEWINVVKNVLESKTSLSKDERQMLQTLSRHENIPRKKAKYLNFVKNVVGFRANMSVVDSCWAKMEAAFKAATETKAPNVPKNQISNEKSEENEKKVTEEITPNNETNENLDLENCQSLENGKSKKKKSKKRVLEQSEEEINEADEPAAKRKHKEESVAVDKDSTTKFNWKANILEILGTKEEMSLKKLRKKVVSKYLDHVENSVTSEKAISRFDKKLSKTSNLILDNGKVKRTES